MRILITGGAGYIGSVAVEQSLAAGHDVVVVDSLWRGHRQAVPDDVELRECDLRDKEGIASVVKDIKPDAIMHFAAAIVVPESVEDPLLYFDVNTVGSHYLITAAINAGVPRFIFSSTAAAYGNTDAEILTEDMPTNPISPYGRSKVMVEQMLEWHQKRYDLNVAIFRYFNVAGATERRGEDHDPETHLIPVALQAASGTRDKFTVFGTDYPTPDGTCIRDYVHVADLADAHILAANWLSSNDWGIFNLGTTNGLSVQQIVQAVEGVTDRTLPVTVGPRREGDAARLIASAERARMILGWNPKRSTVERMVGSAWDWMQLAPEWLRRPVESDSMSITKPLASNAEIHNEVGEAALQLPADEMRSFGYAVDRRDCRSPVESPRATNRAAGPTARPWMPACGKRRPSKAPIRRKYSPARSATFWPTGIEIATHATSGMCRIRATTSARWPMRWHRGSTSSPACGWARRAPPRPSYW